MNIHRFIAIAIPPNNPISNGSTGATNTTLKLDTTPIIITWPSIFPTYSADTLVNNIISLVLAIMGIVAFVGIVYSGYMMITSGGDASKMASARKSLMWSVIGIILVTLSFWIVSFVVNSFK